jgi:dTDP-4-dehydrorhamnose 3,5-epimerase
MRFIETELKGAFIVEPELIRDERGFFARTWCKKEFEQQGLLVDLVQCNISFNRREGTLRGMHFQAAPFEEARLVRCTRGAIYDVIIDLRPDCPTYKRWVSVELTAENRKMLFIPEGFGHGFITLTDNSEVFYQMSAFYAPECARGIRWNDPAFDIDWPAEVKVISEKDMQYPDYSGQGFTKK